MGKIYAAVFTLLILPLLAIAQENSGTAVTLTPQNWFAGAPTYTGGTLGASTSGIAVCSGVSEDDDTWYKFVSTTQAAKIIVQNPGFDAVVQLFTNSLGSVNCLNAAAGNLTETMKVNGLTPGQNYFIRIHGLNGASGTGAFQVAVQYYPTVQVQNSWSPNPNPDGGLVGYKINENTKRTTFSVAENALIQSTRWQFDDISNTDLFTKIVTGTSSLLNLNDVGGLCFGKTYDVSVEIQVDNFWCGYNVVKQVTTEAVPTTTLLPGYSGQYYPIDGDIKAVFVGDGQVLEWELSTDEGSTILYHQTTGFTGSYCYFDEVECIRYNKIYSVRVRASLCGSPFGPWSPYYYVILLPLPYTNVEPEHCNQTLPDGATITCDFIDVANQYAWQFAPIETGDPEMVPIGPATVVYTPWTSCYLLPLGLPLDQTYRVGVKPFLGIGNNDGCDDPQEGDYGQFCPIHLVDFILFNPEDDYNMALNDGSTSWQTFESEEKMLTVNMKPGHTVLTMKTGANAEQTPAVARLYDMQGRCVFDYTCFLTPEVSYLQLPIDPSISSGIYIVELQTGSGIQWTDKIFFDPK
ncbi:MAG: hypothetical protein JNM00_07100 [Flavobacteriales bacterium]|nr:hypothetical protein [Flavobacteriales bacterium]